jgi:transcriptional regulator with XRE-family HTH domain
MPIGGIIAQKMRTVKGLFVQMAGFITSTRFDICQMANYNSRNMDQNRSTNLGEIIRQGRVTQRLTLSQLSSMSGVSSSHLGRIERGERYPSGSILRKIAKPLGFEENELFTLAGYLTPTSSGVAESHSRYGGELDPYVARILAQEPIDVQRAVIGILTILKSLAQSTAKESS